MNVNKVYDFAIVGSGFGGSVAALRLAEKGYSVIVIEQGRRFSPEQFARSDWNLRRFLWMPKLGLSGILKCSFFKEVFILSGVGVGGGSLVYANTLMTPPDSFFNHTAWQRNSDFKNELLPFYEKAKRMMGAAMPPEKENPEDLILKEISEELNCESSFGFVETAVYYGKQDTETDPYFGGKGPLRKGCTGCAGCMTGCRENAKNTLDKNYLWFAEKLGAQILAGTKALLLRFENGIYQIDCRKTLRGGYSGRITAKGLIISGGTLGTLDLLLRQKYLYQTMTQLSDTLGSQVRTNSQSISGLVDADKKLNNGVAISSVFSPDEVTHIEMVKFNDRSGFITHLGGLSAEGSTPVKRAVNVVLKSFRHPLKVLRLMRSFRWGNRSIVMLVMQNTDNSMRMRLRRNPVGYNLSFDKTSGKIPAYIPTGQKVLHRYAAKVNGTAMNSLTETMLNMSTTAHIIGGCPIGENSRMGTVDKHFRVHGYPNMYILDSSVIPCNPGVNPSLTILALSEYAMHNVQPKKTFMAISSNE